MQKNFIIILVLSIAIFVGLIYVATVQKNANSLDYSGFVSCMAQKEVKFYGAFWCPNCQDQKNLFDGQSDLLEENGVYIECSTPDQQSQTPVCIEEGIEGYPTWEINGERISGVVQMEDLSSLTGCELPQEASDE